MNNLTIVTGLFDLGRGDIQEGFRRSFDHYIECFEKFLIATHHLPLVVYLEAKNEHIVWRHRNPENTRVVIKELDYLRAFPFYQQVQRIRQDPTWRGQSGWMPDSPQSSMELYNPMVMSKQFMLNDATLFNFFESKYYLWLDAGLNNTVNLQQYITPDFEHRITKHMNKMLYVCFPYDGDVEVHGFTKGPMDSYAGQKTEYVARGGIFGGSKDAINRVNDIYYGMLNNTINSGYMGTEESIFTIISYTNPEHFNIRMIDGNGLVYKFLEDLQREPVRDPNTPELAFYTLTYNLPKQFALFVESFKNAYPKEFGTCKKYVVNNSTDPAVAEEYKRLFEENGFEEFKFDNIGINDGRHFCAKHFSESGHEYMVFFEDDMLLHTDPKVRCKSGFTTHQQGLFEKAIDITKNEGLDYLKLTFSEFYGDNHDNWAWFNTGNDRDMYFPHREDAPSEKRVRIHYTGTNKGLPFAVGEYHYCNWPILFTQAGNRKVFLDEEREHKFEQAWMAVTQKYMHHKGIKAGCLLASPINHFRKYHYQPGTRKENKH